MKPFYSFFIILILFSCVQNNQDKTPELKDKYPGSSLLYSEETHLRNIKQLTFGGDNAEAYWSFDDGKLVFQAKNDLWGAECDQIFITDTNKY